MRPTSTGRSLKVTPANYIARLCFYKDRAPLWWKDLNRCIAGPVRNTFFHGYCCDLVNLKTKHTLQVHLPLMGSLERREKPLLVITMQQCFLIRVSWGKLSLLQGEFQVQKALPRCKEGKFLVPLRVSGCIWKLKGQKQINRRKVYTFIYYKFYRFRAFMRKWRLKEVVRAEDDASFDERWIVLEQYMIGCWLWVSIAKWEDLHVLSIQILLGILCIQR